MKIVIWLAYSYQIIVWACSFEFQLQIVCLISWFMALEKYWVKNLLQVETQAMMFLVLSLTISIPRSIVFQSLRFSLQLSSQDFALIYLRILKYIGFLYSSLLMLLSSINQDGMANLSKKALSYFLISLSFCTIITINSSE